MKTLGSIFPILRYDQYPSLHPETNMNKYNEHAYLLDRWAQDGVPLGLVRLRLLATDAFETLVIKVYEDRYQLKQGEAVYRGHIQQHRRKMMEMDIDYLVWYVGIEHMLKESERREGPIIGMPELTNKEIEDKMQENGAGHEHEYEDGYCRAGGCEMEDPDWDFDEDCEHKFDNNDNCEQCGYQR